MNALFFEQLLGYADLGVVNFRVQTDTIYLDCISNLSQGINTQNMEKSVKVIDTRQRVVREMSILGKKVVLNIQVRKFRSSSNTFFWEELSMVRVGSHFTKRYEQYIFDSCKGSDMSRIALQEEVGLDSIMGIYHLYAKKTLYHRLFSKVRRLGMDEIALKKGKGDYLVVLVDLDTHEVIDLLESRTKYFLITYFANQEKAFCESIEVFCSDMWTAYLETAKELLSMQLLSLIGHPRPLSLFLLPTRYHQ